MSYERAIDLARDHRPAPPAYELVARQLRAGLDAELLSKRRARWIRAALFLAALGFFAMAIVDEWFAPLSQRGTGRVFACALPIAMLWWVHTRLRRRHLGSQMLVRAVLWSNLVIGLLVAVWGYTVFAPTGSVIAIGSGTALLIMGGRGLGVSDRSFRPVAFRSQLLVALVLACADAETLLFSALLGVGMQVKVALAGQGDAELVGVALRSIAPPLCAGLVMVLAVWGLYRMRVWALLLNIVANLVIAWAALSGHLGLSLPVAGSLALTAALQLLLPVPILAAALGDRNPDRRPLGRWGGPVATTSIFVCTLVGALAWQLPVSFQDEEHGAYTYWRVGWMERVVVVRPSGQVASRHNGTLGASVSPPH